VLYALRFPFSFAVLVVAFVVGLWLRGTAQRLISGQRRPAWARKAARRRSLMWLKPFVDPYGTLAAVIGGPGWGSPVEVNASRSRPGGKVVAQLLAGPVVLCAFGIAALAAFRSWTGLTFRGGDGLLEQALHGELFADGHLRYAIGYAQVALFLAGVQWLVMGVLAILPIPPLDGGKLLFSLAPRSMGWQRARYRLDDENWGVLLLLVVSVIALPAPILLSVLGAILDPVIRLLG